MGEEELLDRVRELRGAGRSPKEIARALRMPPSAVTPLVRAVATERRGTTGGPEVVGCWVNAGWSRGLSVEQSHGWVDEGPSEDDTGGLVSVLVARRHRFDKVSVCGYLVDVYCLGVKNALGPIIMDELELHRFVPTYYDVYPHGWQDTPLELAQHLVLGGVEYARGLGFEPHADFARTIDHLGPWDGSPAITFGRNGKPSYFSGPNDNPRQVIRTLERTVGPPPNFDVLVVQDTPHILPAGGFSM